MISIITPSYNQGQFIEQTIDSVLSQNIGKLEYIIIDGGSTDQTIDVIKRYEKYLSYWVSEPDRGQSHAINKGLQIATGEVVNWLNSDDYLDPNALLKISETFSDPSVNVLCAKSRKFGADGEFISRGTEVYSGNLEKTIGWARIDQPETWFRKEAYGKVGAINEGMHYLMDREWWVRYLFIYGIEGIVQSPEILVNFRLHEDSKTVSQSENFQVDHDTIFMRLAERMGLDQYANLIKKTSSTRMDYTFPALEKIRAERHLFDYYFLRKADESYYSKDAGLCRKFLMEINQSALDSEARDLYDKLAFRSNQVVAPLISWIKKVKS